MAKVADVGTSRILESTACTVSVPMLYTWPYAAPEQISGSRHACSVKVSPWQAGGTVGLRGGGGGLGFCQLGIYTCVLGKEGKGLRAWGGGEGSRSRGPGEGRLRTSSALKQNRMCSMLIPVQLCNCCPTSSMTVPYCLHYQSVTVHPIHCLLYCTDLHSNKNYNYVTLTGWTSCI